jgi:hypothetical protein
LPEQAAQNAKESEQPILKMSEMKHSEERWQVTLIENPAKIFYVQDGNGVDICKINPFNHDKANAERIVACVNGSKDVPSTWFEISSSSTPVADLIEENKLLGKQLEPLRAELAKNKAAREWIEKWKDDLLAMFEALHHEGKAAELCALIQSEEKDPNSKYGKCWKP